MVGSVVALLLGSILTTPASVNMIPTTVEFSSLTDFKWLGILAIMPWAFVGFETTPQISKDIRNSKTNTRSIIVISIVFGSLFYLIINYFTALNMNFNYTNAQTSSWATGEGIGNKLGIAGTFLLSIAMIGSILSGINGFMLSTIKLIESMARFNVAPSLLLTRNKLALSSKRVIFIIACTALFSPWLRRNYLLDIVNMASIGITIGFAYVTYANLVYNYKQNKQLKIIDIFSFTISFAFILTLLLPWSPASLSSNSYILLSVYIVLTMLGYIHVRNNHIRSNGGITDSSTII